MAVFIQSGSEEIMSIKGLYVVCVAGFISLPCFLNNSTLNPANSGVPASHTTDFKEIK